MVVLVVLDMFGCIRRERSNRMMGDIGGVARHYAIVMTNSSGAGGC